ncbi:MAG: SufD family Fe-S cluster assembly protein, partial [Acetobacteraceae bacterium]
MSAVVDFPVKPEARPYRDAFCRSAGEPDWLIAARERALARFAELGFPSRRGEAWRYLDLTALAEEPILPAVQHRADDSARALVAEHGFAEAGWRLVLLDGRFAPELSRLEGLPERVWLGSMQAAVVERPHLVSEAIERAQDAEGAFSALNTAFFADGFVLDIAPGVVLDRPIEILHLTSAEGEGAFHTRSLVSLAAGARAEIIETFAGVSAGRTWRNDVVVLRLDERAELTRTTLIEEAGEAVHFGETTARLDAAARLTDFALVLDGGTVRREESVRAKGAKTRSALSGAFLVAGRRQANLVTIVDHQAPGGETRELFKGVAAGRGHGAFQ